MPSFVAAIVIVLSLVLAAKQHYGSPTFRASIETFLIFILPMLPLIFGFITRDKIGAVLMGIMPFLGLFSVILLGESNSSISGMRWLTRAIPFWLVLIAIAGLEGYFASTRKMSSIFVAICLYILWILCV
jgi:hypothetical protein